jgi:serine/threonine protein kinase
VQGKYSSQSEYVLLCSLTSVFSRFLTLSFPPSFRSVYAFGVTLIEILERGAQPFASATTAHIVNTIVAESAAKRADPPQFVLDSKPNPLVVGGTDEPLLPGFWELVESCCASNATLRPSFSEIVETVDVVAPPAYSPISVSARVQAPTPASPTSGSTGDYTPLTLDQSPLGSNSLRVSSFAHSSMRLTDLSEAEQAAFKQRQRQRFAAEQE